MQCCSCGSKYAMHPNASWNEFAGHRLTALISHELWKSKWDWSPICYLCICYWADLTAAPHGSASQSWHFNIPWKLLKEGQLSVLCWIFFSRQQPNTHVLIIGIIESNAQNVTNCMITWNMCAWHTTRRCFRDQRRRNIKAKQQTANKQQNCLKM